MWGDILHQYPEYIEKLPKNIILLNWDYDKNPAREKVEKFRNMGRDQIVCPGTKTWDTCCENLGVSLPNIKNMANYVYEYGANGILNTNWGDYGNPCSIVLAMCGICYGSEKSWNVASNDDAFFESMDKIIYGFNGAFKHIKELSEIQEDMIWTTLHICIQMQYIQKRLMSKFQTRRLC